MFRRMASCLVLAAAAYAPAAQADDLYVISQANMAILLPKIAGPVEDKSNDKMRILRSSMEGSTFLLFLKDCDASGGHCASFQLYASFKPKTPVTLQTINEWNKTKRYSRAYIDNDGDPAIEMDAVSAGGELPAKVVADIFTNWKLTLRVFRQTIFPSEAAKKP